jgi:hypothetical protein
MNDGGDDDVHAFDLCFAYPGLAECKPVGRRPGHLFEALCQGFVNPGWLSC